MNLSEYLSPHIKRDKNENIKLTSAIRERWEGRIMAQKMVGYSGAHAYLDRYGNNIGLKKVIELSICALVFGDEQMAVEFARSAYAKEYSEAPPDELGDLFGSEAMRNVTSLPPIQGTHPDFVWEVGNYFPQGFRPGELVTMQPVDAKHDKEYYFESPEFFAMPKIDGHRAVVFATPEGVVYQSRSLKIRKDPGGQLTELFQEAAAQFGAFIMDGELWYQDRIHGEHRTSAKAAEANLKLEFDNSPVVRYTAFGILYQGKKNTHETAIIRWRLAFQTAKWIEEVMDEGSKSPIIAVAIAKTTAGKRDLAQKQLTQAKEGEVFIRFDQPYVAGKPGEAFVRTKYLTELVVKVTGYTKSSNPDFAFGALEVSKLAPGEDGMVLVPIGRIGTGFSLAERKELKEMFDTHPDGCWIEIATQGFTPAGNVWHGRYRKLAEYEGVSK